MEDSINSINQTVNKKGTQEEEEGRRAQVGQVTAELLTQCIYMFPCWAAGSEKSERFAIESVTCKAKSCSERGFYRPDHFSGDARAIFLG